MTRRIRSFSRPRYGVIETSQVTLQNRRLLRADPELNRRIVGHLSRALELYPVRLHAVVVLGSHWHVIATYPDPEVMAGFHCHFSANLSKEVGRVYGWTGTVFPDRYHAVELSSEPEIERARLKYLLANGVKEGLVASPVDWPGVSSTQALLTGQPMRGEWVDRAAYWKAKNRGLNVTLRDFTYAREVHLEPLPSLAHLSATAYGQVVRELVDEVEAEGAAMHRAEGTRPLGVAAILSQDPEFRPREVEKRPCPWFHVLDPELRRALYGALVLIMAQYREAAERLKAGDRSAEFPLHTFAPTLGFVRDMEILEPG